MKKQLLQVDEHFINLNSIAYATYTGDKTLQVFFLASEPEQQSKHTQLISIRFKGESAELLKVELERLSDYVHG